MSIVALRKLKNISTAHQLKGNHIIKHQNLVAALAEKLQQNKNKCQIKYRM